MGDIPHDTIAALQEAGLSKKQLSSVLDIINQLLDRNTRKKGCALPDGWAPSEELYQYGAGLGLSRVQVDQAAEEMILWARANAHRAVARKLDWADTFKGWMLRNHKKSRRLSNGANPGTSMSYGEIADRLRQNGNGNGATPHNKQGALDLGRVPTELQPRR